jgi:PPOX class probable F420-dependent enzyme
MLPAEQRRFVEGRRTATLATLSVSGQPRLLPICFVLADPDAHEPGTLLYSPLDEKPKRGTDVRTLARVRDITVRPDVTLLFERWSEDWSRLAWLRARGRASLVEPDLDSEAHRAVVDALRDKYPQYRSHAIDVLPMIRIEISDRTWWSASGHLSESQR